MSTGTFVPVHAHLAAIVAAARPQLSSWARQAIESARARRYSISCWKGRAARFVRAPRFSIEIPFYFRRRGETSWQEGMTDNISRSGVLFRTTDMLEENTPVDMQFTLPVEVSGQPGALVACRGQIVRTVPADSPDALPALAATIARYRFVRRKSLAGA
jgi:PilZ domain-containing protein